MEAAELAAMLGLSPLLPEGGYFRRTYLSSWQPGGVIGGSAIFYLLTPDSPSRFHRLRGDEIYHFYLGDPMELNLLESGGRFGRIILGQDLKAGQKLQQPVPAGVWQGSRLLPGGKWALLGTTMWPAFSMDGYEQGQRDELLAAYPDCADIIRLLTD